MRSSHVFLKYFVPGLFVLLLACAIPLRSQSGKQADVLSPTSPALLQPKELLKILQSGGHKPLVLYVGPRFLYSQKHIVGAEFVGPASDAQALDNLRRRVASLKKDSSVVLYCGCCPWQHCPNIRPAYQELQKLGFRDVKALYLANSFGADWVEKEYPVEKGEPH